MENVKLYEGIIRFITAFDRAGVCSNVSLSNAKTIHVLRPFESIDCEFL